MEFPNSALEDFVIARGNGAPIFALPNAVDDIREVITHVIRGEEHLSNTPKQQLLWEALGARPSVWDTDDREREAAGTVQAPCKVALEDYLAEGDLPQALVGQRRSIRRGAVVAGSAGMDHRGQMGMARRSQSPLARVRYR
jgi:glutamyl-tRNA synthetase